jgi:ribonuclease HI
MATKKKYYAVANGRKPGIYTKWYGPGGAHEQVDGFSKARFQGFLTKGEAEDFIKANSRKKLNTNNRKTNSRKNKVKFPATKPSKQPDGKERVIMYTDGGCLNNPGPGGYGVVIKNKNGKKPVELSGGYRQTTNNRMELMACVVGLRHFKEPCAVTLHSDSQYLVNGITKGWARGWQKKGWIKSDKKPAVNTDLWEQLLKLCDYHDVDFKWVKGHAGILENERCDELANYVFLKWLNLNRVYFF